MSSIFKNFQDNDVTNTQTLLHENIPVTGTIVSSSVYLSGSVSTNVKTYTHGMFSTVFDYPYLSSSANALFDITVGQHSTSPGSSSVDSYGKKKQNIYNQMAQILVGFDSTGSIQKFDQDGQLDTTTTDKYLNGYFLSFSRALVKDEIKKGSFSLVLGVHNSTASAFNTTMTISDASGSTSYKVNSPAGEYGILYATNSPSANENNKVGLIFYQAGIVMLSPQVFAISSSASPVSSMSASSQGQLSVGAIMRGTSSAYTNVQTLFQSGTIDDAVSAFRNRVQNMSFNNTTELNSTIYFCRINHNEFNYSSNPTYLSGSKIRVKNTTTDSPVSYVTSVGLYSIDNELLGVAKLSEPLKKDPSTSVILKIRADY